MVGCEDKEQIETIYPETTLSEQIIGFFDSTLSTKGAST